MASSKEYLEYILGQLSLADEINYRAMMGEYILYCKGKVVGGIYDNRLLVKDTKAAKQLLKAARYELPYEGAKPMLLVEKTDDRELMKHIFESIADEIPEVTKRAIKQNGNKTTHK